PPPAAGRRVSARAWESAALRPACAQPSSADASSPIQEQDNRDRRRPAGKKSLTTSRGRVLPATVRFADRDEARGRPRPASRSRAARARPMPGKTCQMSRDPAVGHLWDRHPDQTNVPCSTAGQKHLDTPKGAVCKTVGSAYVGSNPTPATTCVNGP